MLYTRIFLPLFLLSTFFIHAQTCQTATPICNVTFFTISTSTGVGISSSLTVSNPTISPFPPNSGCLLGGAPNPYWMLLTVANTGTLEFSISENSSLYPQSGFYDWILWRYSDSACTKIYSNTLAPVRCNWNGQPHGGTGLETVPTGGYASNYEPGLPVNAGDQFLLLMDNFNSVTSLVTFSSTGTASLNCTQDYNPDIVTCKNTVETYTVFSYDLNTPTFTLNPGNIIQSSPVFTLSSSLTQIYTITVSGFNNSSTTAVQCTSTFAYSVQPLPILLSDDTLEVCSGEKVKLLFFSDNSLPVNITGPNAYNQNYTPKLSGDLSLLLSSSGVYSATTTNSLGCSQTNTLLINVNACLGLFESEIVDFKIWPNPVERYLYFQEKEKIDLIEINDVCGRIVKIIPEQSKADLGFLTAGIYFLNFYRNNNRIAKSKILLLK